MIRDQTWLEIRRHPFWSRINFSSVALGTRHNSLSLRFHTYKEELIIFAQFTFRELLRSSNMICIETWKKYVELKKKIIIPNPNGIIWLWRQEVELNDFREMVNKKVETEVLWPSLAQPYDPICQTLLLSNLLCNGGFTGNQNSLLGTQIILFSNPTAKI